MTVTENSVSGQPGTGRYWRLRIARRQPGEARPRIEEFAVAAGPEATLLEVLRDIRSHHDRSLTLRYSCCHASCGTCGMRMNGREVLACVTRLADAGPGAILVEPLANARIEHDLVVDMRDLYLDLEPAQRPLIRQAGHRSQRRTGSPASRNSRSWCAPPHSTSTWFHYSSKVIRAHRVLPPLQHGAFAPWS